MGGFPQDEGVLAVTVFCPWLNLFANLFYLISYCNSSLTFREDETFCYLLQPHQNGEAVELVETARENAQGLCPPKIRSYLSIYSIKC